MNEHFQLTDSSGATVRRQRLGYSTVLSDQQCGGAPEFWVKTSLKPVATYQFDYTPIVPGPHYRHELHVPPSQVQPDWILFEKHNQ